MPQPFGDAMNWVPKSRAMAATLSRAHDFARAHGHLAVGLEHLLLSLIEDQDAASVLEASGVALENLSADVAAHLANLPVDEGAVPEVDESLLRILEYAVAAAQQSRRRDVNGGIVLAAIVGEGKSEAANLLRHHGMTFAAAIEAIKGGPRTVTGPPGGVPAPAKASAPPPSDTQSTVHDAASDTTEEILARARRRVEALQAPAPPPAAPSRVEEPKTERPQADLPLTLEPADEAAHAAETPPALPPSPPPPLVPPPPPPPAPPSWLPPGPPAAAPSTHAARIPPPMPPLVEPLATDRPVLRPDPYAPPPPPLPPGRPPNGPAIAPWNEPPARADTPRPLPPKTPHDLTADLGREEHPASAQPKRRRRRNQQRPDLHPDAALAHTFDPERFAAALPRRARSGKPFTVEIGLDRSEVAAFAAFGDPPSTSLTLRLGVGSGAAMIETGPPETIWLDAAAGVYSEDSAVWRWTVTPKRAGRLKLRFTGNLRSQDSDGRPLEASIPDHTIELRVGRNYGALFGQLILVSIVAGAAAAFDDTAEPLLNQFIQVVRTYVGK